MKGLTLVPILIQAESEKSEKRYRQKTGADTTRKERDWKMIILDGRGSEKGKKGLNHRPESCFSILQFCLHPPPPVLSQPPPQSRVSNFTTTTTEPPRRRRRLELGWRNSRVQRPPRTTFATACYIKYKRQTPLLNNNFLMHKIVLQSLRVGECLSF